VHKYSGTTPPPGPTHCAERDSPTGSHPSAMADVAHHGVVTHAAPAHGGSEHSCSGGAVISAGTQYAALASVPSRPTHCTVRFRAPAPHDAEHADHWPSRTA
jgi:hypothetical protein